MRREGAVAVGEPPGDLKARRPVVVRGVLAHELAHAVFGHVPSRFGPVAAKQERVAEEWAALRLIRLEDYRRAEELHDGHAGAIAQELGVVLSIVEAYRAVLLRIRVEGESPDLVYVQPRLGAGGWTERLETRESA